MGGRGGGGDGGLPYSFSEIWKKCPNFGKKRPDGGHLLIKRLSVIFKSFQEKKLEIFLCGVFIFRVDDDCLQKCPDSKKTFLP